MAKINKANLKKAFSKGELNQKMMGSFIENVMQYRAYYLDNKRKTNWAGPWRNDLAAASADGLAYAQQGFETGISCRMN